MDMHDKEVLGYPMGTSVLALGNTASCWSFHVSNYPSSHMQKSRWVMRRAIWHASSETQFGSISTQPWVTCPCPWMSQSMILESALGKTLQLHGPYCKCLPRRCACGQASVYQFLIISSCKCQDANQEDQKRLRVVRAGKSQARCNYCCLNKNQVICVCVCARLKGFT